MEFEHTKSISTDSNMKNIKENNSTLDDFIAWQDRVNNAFRDASCYAFLIGHVMGKNGMGGGMPLSLWWMNDNMGCMIFTPALSIPLSYALLAILERLSREPLPVKRESNDKDKNKTNRTKIYISFYIYFSLNSRELLTMHKWISCVVINGRKWTKIATKIS